MPEIFAFKKTKGSLITFLDADDWWDKSKLIRQVGFLEKNKEYNVVYANLFLFNEKRNKISLFSKKNYITVILLNNY